jgi:hypothetical protein
MAGSAPVSHTPSPSLRIASHFWPKPSTTMRSMMGLAGRPAGVGSAVQRSFASKRCSGVGASRLTTQRRVPSKAMSETMT